MNTNPTERFENEAKEIVHRYRQMNECLLTNEEFLEGRIVKALTTLEEEHRKELSDIRVCVNCGHKFNSLTCPYCYCEEFRSENKLLRSNLSDANSKIRELEEENSLIRAENERLKDKLKTCTDTHVDCEEYRDLISWGVRAIAILTALDVSVKWELCDEIKQEIKKSLASIPSAIKETK